MVSSSLGRVTLATLTRPMRALFTCFLLTIGLGYIAALLYLFLVDVDPHRKMGMSTADGIAMKYHGQQGGTRLENALSGTMSDRAAPADKQAILDWVKRGANEADFASVKPAFEKTCVACHSTKSGLPIPPLTTYEEVRKLTAVDTGAGISQLARVSHVHLFGISIIFLLTGGIFAMSEFPVRPRVAILILPYVAIWADIGSWWITKYVSIFSWVVLVGGGVMGLMLAAQILISLWEMWFKRSRAATPLED